MAAQCAIFSTFDIHLARYDQPLAEIWRRTQQTQYWKKPVWIIPVHRDVLEHWVVVVVYPAARRILFYDSLASPPSDCPDLIKVTFSFQFWGCFNIDLVSAGDNRAR